MRTTLRISLTLATAVVLGGCCMKSLDCFEVDEYGRGDKVGRYTACDAEDAVEQCLEEHPDLEECECAAS